MATSTYMTFLMHKKESTYEKLIDIVPLNPVFS